VDVAAGQQASIESTDWYGEQTLLADGLSLLFALGAAGGETEPLLVLASAGYVLGGPIVHLAHGSLWRAGVSLGLRVGLPLLFTAIGVQLEDCHSGEDFCGLGSVVIGGSLGILTAIVLDAAVLAYEPVRKARAIEPVLGLRDGAVWLGARGTL
jgi:hypothetical protein